MKKTSKLVRLSLMFLLWFYLNSCGDQSSITNEENIELINTIKQDHLFKSIQESQLSRQHELLCSKFDLSKLDKSILSSEIKNCITEQDFIRLYKKAGMKNADEYFGQVTVQINLLNRLAGKYPQLNKMSEGDRKKLFDKLFTVNDSTVAENISVKIKSTN